MRVGSRMLLHASIIQANRLYAAFVAVLSSASCSNHSILSRPHDSRTRAPGVDSRWLPHRRDSRLSTSIPAASRRSRQTSSGNQRVLEEPIQELAVVHEWSRVRNECNDRKYSRGWVGSSHPIRAARSCQWTRSGIGIDRDERGAIFHPEQSDHET